MSNLLLSKTHIDAIVTAAVQWGRDGFCYRFCDRRHSVTPANATEVGSMLWEANIDTVTEGDPEDLASWTDGRGLPPYEFDALDGNPDPLTVKHLISYYIYQTCGDPDPWYGSQPQVLLDELSLWATAVLAREGDWGAFLDRTGREAFRAWPTRLQSDGPS